LDLLLQAVDKYFLTNSALFQQIAFDVYSKIYFLANPVTVSLVAGNTFYYRGNIEILCRVERMQGRAEPQQFSFTINKANGKTLESLVYETPQKTDKGISIYFMFELKDQSEIKIMSTTSVCNIYYSTSQNKKYLISGMPTGIRF